MMSLLSSIRGLLLSLSSVLIILLHIVASVAIVTNRDARHPTTIIVNHTYLIKE
jgi:hypothetical protein